MRSRCAPSFFVIAAPVFLSLLACPEDKATPVGDPAQQARDELLVRLTERSGRIVDYRIKGRRCYAACDSASPELQHFVMELRAPGLFRIELADDKKLITFDGSTLIETQQDGSQQRIPVQATGGNSALPYQVSGQFITEGWRAPLLASTELVAARLEKDERGGQVVVLQRPLQDAQLDRVEYWFRLPKADFIRTRFVTKDGRDLKRVEVTQEHRDSRSGYAFPRRWRIVDAQGQVTSWVQLDQIAINTGVAKARFKQ